MNSNMNGSTTNFNLHEVWTHFLADIMAIAQSENSATIQWIHLRIFLKRGKTLELWPKNNENKQNKVGLAIGEKEWLGLSRKCKTIGSFSLVQIWMTPS